MKFVEKLYVFPLVVVVGFCLSMLCQNYCQRHTQFNNKNNKKTMISTAVDAVELLTISR